MNVNDKEVLISGAIDPLMFDNFSEFLISSGVQCSLELYNDDKELIMEFKSDQYFDQA